MTSFTPQMSPIPLHMSFKAELPIVLDLIRIKICYHLSARYSSVEQWELVI